MAIKTAYFSTVTATSGVTSNGSQAHLLPLSAAGVRALAMPGVRWNRRGLWALVSINILQSYQRPWVLVNLRLPQHLMQSLWVGTAALLVWVL